MPSIRFFLFFKAWWKLQVGLGLQVLIPYTVCCVHLRFKTVVRVIRGKILLTLYHFILCHHVVWYTVGLHYQESLS